MKYPLSRRAIASVVLCCLIWCPVRLSSGDEAKANSVAVAADVHPDAEFAFDVYRRLSAQAGEDKNVLFSPFSVYRVLMMVAEGAKGETAEQMGHALHFPQTLHGAGPAADVQPWDLRSIRQIIANPSEQPNILSEPERKAIESKLANLRQQLESPDLPHNEKQLLKIEPKVGENRLDPSEGLTEDMLEAFIRNRAELRRKINELVVQLDPSRLSVASSLWIDKSSPIERAYSDIINREYPDAGLFSAEFGGSRGRARLQINDWIEHKTQRQIPNFLAGHELNAPTKLVVANATCFDGRWRRRFPVDETVAAEFFTGNGTGRAPMMHVAPVCARYAAYNANGSLFQTPETVNALHADDTRQSQYPGKGGMLVLEVSYQGNAQSMIAILPSDKADLASLSKDLTAARFHYLVSELRRRNVDLYFPKFRLESNSNLAAILNDLGMKRVFTRPNSDGNGAQLGGICTSNDAYISDLIDRAIIDVNEKGTDAAAMCGENPVGVAPDVMIPFVPVVRCDRPFIFAIVDSNSGAILLLGQVGNPEER